MFAKNIILLETPLFFDQKIAYKQPQKKNRHNFLPYKMVNQILYSHIFNIAEFG